VSGERVAVERVANSGQFQLQNMVAVVAVQVAAMNYF